METGRCNSLFSFFPTHVWPHGTVSCCSLDYESYTICVGRMVIIEKKREDGDLVTISNPHNRHNPAEKSQSLCVLRPLRPLPGPCLYPINKERGKKAASNINTLTSTHLLCGCESLLSMYVPVVCSR